MKPPNPQTDIDREYLRSLFYLFKDLPFDFEFPLVINGNYVPPSNSLYCFIIGAVACCITIPTVFLRLWVRYKSGFGTDDWIIVPALISYCVFSAVNAVAVWGTGMGYHVYDLSRKDIHNFIVVSTWWKPEVHFIFEQLLCIDSHCKMTEIMVSSYDITWNATDVAFWSMFECSLACIIACLPALNHLIIKFLKKVTKFLRLNENRGPKLSKGKVGAIRFPARQAEAYQRSVISNGYGQYVKRWANNSSSRPGSEYSAADAPMRWGSRSGSTTTSNSSTYPSTYSATNNSSVMETTIYIIDEIPSDVEEEGQPETFGNISTAGLGPGNIPESDPKEHSPSSSEKADASENV
ncbi:hypothetical protein TWF679_010224 [Orbilia oligospora]|uniref:Rhodopsin domain-containing protein n=1 Tax=Orbilia oligospora TaxID=2813651 RepID=A0A8H8V0U7_ORBOL|nr:hypothetical protein TWF679_010224 [Orbilia oligospora]